MRRQPLPPDVLTTIRIAAGSEEAIEQALRERRIDRRAVRDGAILYLQSVVLYPEADHYRMLGAPRGAPQEQLREHMQWLMKWLHPDRAPDEWEAVSAQRVLAAWQELKHPERRARYDRTLPPERVTTARRRRTIRRHLSRSAPRIPWIAIPSEISDDRNRRRLIVAGVLLLILLTLAFFLSPSDMFERSVLATAFPDGP